MKSLLIATLLAAGSVSQAEMICTVSTTKQSPYAFQRYDIVTSGLVNPGSNDQRGFLIKKDGTALKDVKYDDIVQKSASLGDVDGATFILFGRDQGAKEGVSVVMGTLSAENDIPRFEIEASSPKDEVSLTNKVQGIAIICVPTQK